MKTISEEVCRLLDRCFGYIKMTEISRSDKEVRTVGSVTYMGQEFIVERRETLRRGLDYGGWFESVSSDITISPTGNEWSLSRHIFGNPCGELPIRVRFVGIKSAFDRDMTMLKMLVHRPVGDVRMAT